MTDEDIKREIRFLRSVLQDALDRGDYYLEMDVKERINQLQQARNEEEDK